jgi:hypothetical protein
VLLEVVRRFSSAGRVSAGADATAFMNAEIRPFFRERYLSWMLRRSGSLRAAARSVSNCCLSETMSMRLRQSFTTRGQEIRRPGDMLLTSQPPDLL